LPFGTLYSTNITPDKETGIGNYSDQPAFGNDYSDVEIAAVANYVTARFGSKPAHMTAQDVAALRKQTSQ